MRSTTFVEGDRVKVAPIVLAVLSLVLVGLLIWGAGVATSAFFGRGNQIKQINSWENQTYSQQHFEELYGDITAYDGQIAVVAAVQNPTDKQVTDLQGLRLICIDTVAQYNADARKIQVGAWRSVDLPSSISTGEFCAT